MSASPHIFDGPDADVILRAPLQPGSEEFKDFHVHKLILSIASIVFRDTFSIPQPSCNTSESTTLDVVQVTESAEALETFLQFIYPVDPPVIEDLRLVDDLFQLTEKYMAKGVSTKLKKLLVSPSFLKDDPIGVFAIARRHDLDEEERLAISHTFSVNVVSQISERHLQIMTAKTYHHLLTEHSRRREQLINAAHSVQCLCRCGEKLEKEMRTRMTERPYLDRGMLEACLPSTGSMDSIGCGSHRACTSLTPGLRSAFLAEVTYKILTV